MTYVRPIVDGISSSRRLVLLVILSASLLASCSGPRPAIERDVPAAFPGHSLSQIRNHLDAHGDTLSAFRAKASLAIKAPENSGSFTADLHSRRNDSFFVAISPGLGIEAARALVTPDSFYFYDRLKNRLLFGPLSAASEFLPEPFTSDDLFASMLGTLAPEAAIDWEIEADDRYYYLKDAQERTLYVIDPSIWRVVRYETQDEWGKLVERRTYSEFGEFDGVVLPRRLEFERPLDDQRVSLYYRSLRLDPENLRFDLDARSSVERVRIDE